MGEGQGEGVKSTIPDFDPQISLGEREPGESENSNAAARARLSLVIVAGTRVLMNEVSFALSVKVSSDTSPMSMK